MIRRWWRARHADDQRIAAAAQEASRQAADLRALVSQLKRAHNIREANR